MLGRRSRENITTLLFSKMNHFFLQPRSTHQQEIFNSKDVAAQDRRPDLLYPKALATPWRTGSRDNVIASDWWQLLRQHLGLAIGKVSVAGYDGSFWNHDAGTCVLKVGMDRNFITWQCERGKRMLSTENDFSSVHLPNPRSRLIRLLFSALGFFFFTFTESSSVNSGRYGHAPIGNEHAGNFLLFFSRHRFLCRMGGGKVFWEFLEILSLRFFPLLI